MGLLIHDLSPEGWAKVSREYDGWDIVSDNESIRPCVGCFSCWNRDPGRCAIKDGYEKKDMSGLVRKLEDAPAIVLCIPLYVDGLPSQVIRLMEKFEQEYKGGKKKIYVLANMGLYESRQL